MSAFEKEKEFICSMLKSNGYGMRDGKMPGDDFRIFLTPPEFEVESEEIFKLKGNDVVHCGAVIMLGGEMRDAFFKQSRNWMMRMKIYKMKTKPKPKTKPKTKLKTKPKTSNLINKNHEIH